MTVSWNDPRLENIPDTDTPWGHQTTWKSLVRSALCFKAKGRDRQLELVKQAAKKAGETSCLAELEKLSNFLAGESKDSQ